MSKVCVSVLNLTHEKLPLMNLTEYDTLKQQNGRAPDKPLALLFCHLPFSQNL